MSTSAKIEGEITVSSGDNNKITTISVNEKLWPSENWWLNRHILSRRLAKQIRGAMK